MVARCVKKRNSIVSILEKVPFPQRGDSLSVPLVSRLFVRMESFIGTHAHCETGVFQCWRDLAFSDARH